VNKTGKNILKFLILIISMSILNLSAMKGPVLTSEEVTKIERFATIYYKEAHETQEAPKTSLDKLKGIFFGTKKMLNLLQDSLHELSKCTAQTPVGDVEVTCNKIKGRLDELRRLISAINYYINKVIEEKKAEIEQERRRKEEKREAKEKQEKLDELEKKRKDLEKRCEALEQVIKESKVQISDFSKVTVELKEKITDERIKSFGELESLWFDIESCEKYGKYKEAAKKIVEYLEKFKNSLTVNFSVKYENQDVIEEVKNKLDLMKVEMELLIIEIEKDEVEREKEKIEERLSTKSFLEKEKEIKKVIDPIFVRFPSPLNLLLGFVRKLSIKDEKVKRATELYRHIDSMSYKEYSLDQAKEIFKSSDEGGYVDIFKESVPIPEIIDALSREIHGAGIGVFFGNLLKHLILQIQQAKEKLIVKLKEKITIDNLDQKLDLIESAEGAFVLGLSVGRLAYDKAAKVFADYLKKLKELLETQNFSVESKGQDVIDEVKKELQSLVDEIDQAKDDPGGEASFHTGTKAYVYKDKKDYARKITIPILEALPLPFKLLPGGPMEVVNLKIKEEYLPGGAQAARGEDLKKAVEAIAGDPEKQVEATRKIFAPESEGGYADAFENAEVIYKILGCVKFNRPIVEFFIKNLKEK